MLALRIASAAIVATLSLVFGAEQRDAAGIPLAHGAALEAGVGETY